MPRHAPSAPLWNEEELRILSSLKSPEAIQEFLDGIPYNVDSQCRSPRRVMRDRKAHCMEGALFAAAGLERLGQKPRIVDLMAVRDDDHIIAIFKARGKYGSVAKSNFTGLRYRSPIYRTLRELVLSYFDDYFNSKGELTLRKYTPPLLLSTRRFGAWHTREDDLYDVSSHFDRLRPFTIISPVEARRLRPADDKLYQAGLLGANRKGLYKVS